MVLSYKYVSLCAQFLSTVVSHSKLARITETFISFQMSVEDRAPRVERQARDEELEELVSKERATVSQLSAVLEAKERELTQSAEKLLQVTTIMGV